MTKRRDELSDEDNFGDEALVVSNLCSSGYYDEDGYIRDLFRKAEEQRTDENSVHQRLYNLILAEEPFTVFVSPSNNPHKIAEELVEKLEKSGYYMVEFDFVDAHAQGGSNRDILEKTVINLHISSERLKYIAEINERETVFRFDSESFVASE